MGRLVVEAGSGTAGTSGDSVYVMHNGQGGPHRTIIALHGDSVPASTYGPLTAGGGGPHEHMRSLVDAGYAVYAIDAAGLHNWSAPAAMSAIGGTATTGLARFGGSRVGLIGPSMGGLGALNWQKRNPTLVAGTFLLSPATDLKWCYALSGYTPSYSTGSVTAQSGWVSEINTAFGCTTSTFTSTTAGFRVVDEYATWADGIPKMIVYADDDAALPKGQFQAFTAAVPQVRAVELTTGGHLPWTSFDPGTARAFFDTCAF